MWETLSASFGHYALILLMSPRLIVLVICSETSALTRCGDLWEPPSIATGTIPCPEATTSSPRFKRICILHDDDGYDGKWWYGWWWYVYFSVMRALCIHIARGMMRKLNHAPKKWMWFFLVRRHKRWGRRGESARLSYGSTSGWVAFWTRCWEGTVVMLGGREWHAF